MGGRGASSGRRSSGGAGEVKTLEQGIKEFREAMRAVSPNPSRDDEFISIPKLRKELQNKRGWTREEVDNMITYLVYDGGLDPVATDRGKYKESDFYYFEDGTRIGMLRWLHPEQNYYYIRDDMPFY